MSRVGSEVGPLGAITGNSRRTREQQEVEEDRGLRWRENIIHQMNRRNKTNVSTESRYGLVDSCFTN